MKKYKVYLLILVLLLGVIAVPTQSVYAYDIVESNVDFVDYYWPYQQNIWLGYKQIPNFYITKWFNGVMEGDHATGMVYIQRLDKPGKAPIYCVEPDEEFNNSLTGYTNFDDISQVPNINNITQEQWENIRLYAYFGYGYGNHTSDMWYGVTKCMIWEEADPTLVINYSTTREGAINDRVHYKDALASYYNEIMNLVNNYKKKPNFEISNLNDNNEVGEVGVETVYEDTNNVLSTFSIAETKNCTARIDGNKLYITARNPGKVSIKFARGNESDKSGTVYTSATSQNVMVGSSLYTEFTFEPEEFGNDCGSISLIKLPTDTLNNIILNGDKVDTTELEQEAQELANIIKGMSEEQVKEYFEKNEIKGVSGAKYGIYLDEACTQPLYRINEAGEKEKVEIVTNDTGIMKIEDVQFGEYYIKEIEAPKGYELSDEVTKITLDISNKDTMVYQALIEEDFVESSLTKLDAFSGEAIPNCVFELRDENGDLILKSITDENGIGYVPVRLLENGKTYTYTEIEAPKMYELNTEPHEFVASYDEETYEWTGEKIVVENVRKESTVTFEKLDVMDSTPIPNCKFELKSLETDFVVTGVTDENGVYVFENIPYGRYTYTELEAPEEYIIDTTPHEITISEEQTRVIVTNERAPETGDIAVMMVTSIAVVSVIGIAFVMIKNKRKTNE